MGWLVINIWHNAQYILFVWAFNNRHFQGGVDPKARFLSYISQSGRLWLYMIVCIGLTGLIYWGGFGAVEWLFVAGATATIVLYQTVNFHHYVVDAMISKVRKPQFRQTLGMRPG